MKKNHNCKSKKIISIFIIYFALNFISWILISFIWRISNYLPFEMLGGLPIILIFIYILTVHKKNNNIVLLQIAFILFPLLILLEIIINFNFIYIYEFLGFLYLSLNLLLLVGWVLNIISSFKGFLNSFGKIKSKYILYITFLITSTVKLTELLIFIAKYGLIDPVNYKVLLCIATLLVYFSLFIFFKNTDFSKNKIRDLIEGELISLKEKLDLKIITEEEFQEKRKDILNNT